MRSRRTAIVAAVLAVSAFPYASTAKAADLPDQERGPRLVATHASVLEHWSQWALLGQIAVGCACDGA